MRWSMTSVLFVLWLTLAGPALAAPEPLPLSTPARKAPVSYSREVADILGAKCVGCHSDALAESKLNIEEVAGMLKGGKHGPSIVPGKADESLLFKMAAHRVEPVMPPKDKKDAKPLSSEELGLLKLWIDAGAKDDSSENAEAAKPVVLGALPPGVQPINAVDITGDGRLIASGRANVVQVFDADSGLEIIALGGHKDLIQSLRFSPDGRRLAAGSYEIVSVWNVPTSGLAATFTGHNDQVVDVISGGEDGTIVSSGLDKTIRVWDRAGKPLKQTGLPAPALSMALSPDRTRLLAGCGDGVLRLFEVSKAWDLKQVAEFKGHSGPIHDVALLADEKGLREAITVSGDGSARVWNLQAKPGTAPEELEVPPNLKSPLRSLAVDARLERVFAGGEDGKVRVWSLHDGKLLRTFDISKSAVLALALNELGDELLTGSADKTARLLDVKSGKVKVEYRGHLSEVTSVAFASSATGKAGDQIVTGGAEGGIKVWDKATAQGVTAFGHTAPNNGQIQRLNRVLVTKPGELVSASSDKTLKSWKYEGTWTEHETLGPHAFRVLALDFNPDGTLLAAGGGEPSRSGEVRLWEVGKGLPVRTLSGLHSDTVFGLRFSPDGGKLASAGADKFMKITRVCDGKEIRAFEGHTHHVLAVDWKPDGKQLVTGGADNVLKLWDAESGEQVRTSQPAGKQIDALRWIPGKAQVVGACGDKVARVWNPDNGGVIRTFNGPSDYVFSVAVSNDGNRLAGGGADGVLYLWNVQNGQVIRKFEPVAQEKGK